MKQKEIFNVRKVKIENDEEKHIICLGDNLVSRKQFNTEEDACKYIDEKPWELITAITTIIALSAPEFKEPKKE